MGTSETSGRAGGDRRRFLRLAAGAVVVTGVQVPGHASATPGQSSATPTPPATSTSFGPVKQVRAGELSVGYVEAGPAGGPPVVLMHGYPYDIHSYAEVAPLLAAHGYRVVVPYFRGHGSTRFLSSTVPRNAEQVVFALDVIAMMDALKIRKPILAGFGWGSRTGDIIAALWPQRCRALVSVAGYLVTNVEASRQPLPPKAEWAWWYQYYFAIERGVLGLQRYRRDLARLVWKFNSPTWHFDDATFNRTAAAFDNPDYVSIVIGNYRWRLGLIAGDSRYDRLEKQLFREPVITVPTITVDGRYDPFTLPGNGSAYRRKFGGRYAHRVVKVGHNVPQEAPDAFAQAVIDADHL